MNKTLCNIIAFVIAIFQMSGIFAQNKYWVYFSDKDGVKFDPYSFFDQKAIDRRIKSGIDLFDKSDFPVNQEYIKTVSQSVTSTSYASRWFNSLAVNATEVQIELVKKLPFVVSVEAMQYFPVLAGITTDIDTILSTYQSTLLKNQTLILGGDVFQTHNINGKGLRIAVFDGGFPGVNTSPVFEHIRQGGRIIKTWDFTKKNENVYRGVSHGTYVLSCIAGVINGTNIGLATGSEFLLAITEVKSEPFFEEENWLAAMEWADKNGADIINSSLGYTYHRYFPEQMNGKTALVSRAATMAARKGILVINAAGNEGDNKWKYIGAPADADSIITVGGINPDLGIHTSFSSFGPTSDKRLKPNVCAFGHVVAASKSGLSSTQGTSFASPLVAGFAACAWQTNRDKNNMEMIDEIQKSASLYPYFDYAHGYGIPQAAYFMKESSKLQPSFQFISEGELVRIVVNEVNSNESSAANNYLYYNIQGENGVLEFYYVIKVYDKEVIEININDYTKKERLNVHYKGYTNSFQF